MPMTWPVTQLCSASSNQQIAEATSDGSPMRPSGCSAADILATVYRVMGIDPQIAFKDHAGRPIPILDEGKAIEEIL